MITAFYMFRLFFLTFFTSFRGTEEEKHHLHESPWTMTLPLAILSLFAIGAGFLGMPAVMHMPHWFNGFLAPVVETSKSILGEAHHVDHNTEIMLMLLATALAVTSIVIAYVFYVSRKTVPEPDTETKGLAKWVANKFYIDELYNAVFVKPMMVLSDVFHVVIDKLVIDLFVNASAWMVGFTGRTLRLVQTGNTGFYIFIMVFAMMVLLLIQLVQ
jgi:NADH-quinone oxidoreductase subunit L